MFIYKEKSFVIYAVAFYLLATLVLVSVSVNASDGHLIYTLDDPYIHLAVAENILRGGYGVNYPEFSSPSSSILFPFLLSALMRLGLNEYGPLILGVSANVATIALSAPIIYKYAVGRNLAGSRILFFVTPPLFFLATNLIALPMTGMEHTIHVLAVVLVVSGLLRLTKSSNLPWRLVIGTFLSSIIRFEGLALSFAVIALAFAMKRRAFALVMFVAISASLAAYSALLHSMGLPVLPSSVLVKSPMSANLVDGGMMNALKAIQRNLFQSLVNRWGMLFTISAALLLPFLYNGLARSHLAIVSIFALVAHILMGRYGWFGRYEVYGVTLMLLTLIFYFSSYLLYDKKMKGRFIFPVLLAFIAAPYVAITLDTPRASKNIYEQQYQMHRFAVDYFPEAVAVNDLGWVAYKNEKYVLDLLGLGSEKARQAARHGIRGTDFIQQIASDHDVVYAMIYSESFKDAIPGGWCPIAKLTTSWVTTAFPSVEFYLIDPAKAEAMGSALGHFRTSLPQGAQLEVLKCTSS